MRRRGVPAALRLGAGAALGQKPRWAMAEATEKEASGCSGMAGAVKRERLKAVE